MELSKSQVDKLGERLRDAPPTRDDVKLLESYKHSFVVPHQRILESMKLKRAFLFWIQ